MRTAKPAQRGLFRLEGLAGQILQFKQAQHPFGAMPGKWKVFVGPAMHGRTIQIEDNGQFALAYFKVGGQGVQNAAGNSLSDDSQRMLIAKARYDLLRSLSGKALQFRLLQKLGRRFDKPQYLLK